MLLSQTHLCGLLQLKVSAVHSEVVSFVFHHVSVHAPDSVVCLGDHQAKLEHGTSREWGPGEESVMSISVL